jgi:hypothetical protein
MIQDTILSVVNVAYFYIRTKYNIKRIFNKKSS